MKRSISALCLLLAVALMAGCAQKLSDAFDEKTLLSAAQDIVMLYGDGKYDDVTARVREDLREALSAQVLASSAQQMLSDAGAFVEFGKHTVAGQKEKATGKEYALVVLQAKYANKTCIYTLAFDADMQVVGFYIK